MRLGVSEAEQVATLRSAMSWNTDTFPLVRCGLLSLSVPLLRCGAFALYGKNTDKRQHFEKKLKDFLRLKF